MSEISEQTPARPAHPAGRAERGATLFVVAMVLLILLLAGALAVDLSVVATRGQSLQNAADSAALAGVQALRESIEDTTGTGDVNEAQAAAATAVSEILAQNGISPTDQATSFQLEFPDPLNNTAVKVTVVDQEPGTLLTGVTGVTSDVERSAVAEFESCSSECFVSVPIPPPFAPVDVSGSGDGFIPVLVDNKMYALNHHHAKGALVCVDIRTQDPCWDTIERPAYATGYWTTYNPDDPMLMVHDDILFWVAGDGAGTKIYCWVTSTDTPCSQGFPLNDRSPFPSLYWTWLTHSRASGPSLLDGQIYVLTDDHRMHCVVATLPMTTCPGYGANGNASELALRNFPGNRTQDGNNGDGNFSVTNEDNGKIYTLTQVRYRGPQPVDCSESNMSSPSGRVMIQNAQTGEFLETDRDRWNTETNVDRHYWGYWDVEPQGNGTYRFRNVYHGQRLGASGPNAKLVRSQPNDQFEVEHYGGTSTLGLVGQLVNGQNPGNIYLAPDTSTPTGPPADLATQWIIRPFECFDATQPTVAADASYSPGTWIQCWDTSAGAPCSNFTASLIHDNAPRNWGRLFFNRSGSGAVTGVCSFGLKSGLRLVCVDHSTGVRSSAQESALSSFSSEYLSFGGGWLGVPYYHEDLNRMFVSANWGASYAVCWDFTTGSCGSAFALTPNGAKAHEYGYLGFGDCIIGLGHRSVFRAFDANDIFEPCSSSTTNVRVNPCNCSGETVWGNATFDIDLSLYDEFTIAVVNPAGEQVFPAVLADGTVPPPHSLFDGTEIDLSNVPIAGPLDYLEFEISVQAPDDPWAVSEQRVEMTFGNRRPVLTD